MGEGVRPAAKMYLDLKVSEICEKAELVTSPSVLEFTVGADDKTARTSVKLDDALTERLRRTCTRAGPAEAQGPAQPKKLNP
ncbi:MAG: hypothetical protein V3U39_07700 [Acidimicrobiia bacterium]